MRVLNIKQAVQFMNAPAPDGLGMDITHHWLRKMAEPDHDGKRGLPFFKVTDGKTAALYTTDEALIEHFRRLVEAARVEHPVEDRPPHRGRGWR